VPDDKTVLEGRAGMAGGYTGLLYQYIVPEVFEIDISLIVGASHKVCNGIATGGGGLVVKAIVTLLEE
jgi:hypothetical protein